MRIFKKKSILILAVFAIFSSVLFVSNVNVVEAKYTINNASGFLNKAVRPTGVQKITVTEFTGSLIKSALSVVGVLFLALTVYAGLLWMSARGKEESITKARNTLIATTIGLVVVVSAYVLTNMITTRVIEGGGSGYGALSGGEGDPLGCCADKVFGGGDDWGISGQSAATWACRITTKSDCKFRGEDSNDPNDVLYGPDLWRFFDSTIEVDKCAQKCNELDNNNE